MPTDGVVLEGTTTVDESMLSGEPVPVPKQPGDPIVGATINGSGSLLMRAEKIGAETLLSRIVAMVRQAQQSRAPVQRLADVVAGYFVPIVIAVAVWSGAASIRWPPPSCMGRRSAASRGRGDELQLRVGHRQCAAASTRPADPL